MTARWRSELPVFVADAHAMGSVAVIRSLGRAGYPVHAAAASAGALGLRSAYASVRTLSPPYSDPGFIPWLRDYVATHGIRAIVPSEGLVLAMQPCFEELAPLLPYRPSGAAVLAAMSKFETLRTFLAAPQAARNIPPTLHVDLDGSLPEARDIEALALPMFIKVDACYARSGQSGAVTKADSAAAALRVLQARAGEYRAAIVQGFAPGVGVGVFFLRWRGRILAQFMHRRVHEVPHTGGVSSLRESWVHDEILEDARAKLEHLDWEGVAMLEYRWDAAARTFHFMELNARFWGSLHLALYAGVDFPRLLLDAFFDRPNAPVIEFPAGVRCRQTFPREVQYVWSVCKDKDVELGRKLGAILEFCWLGVNPRVYSDLSFPGDRGLAWRSLWEFARADLLRPLVRAVGIGRAQTGSS